MVTLLIGYPDFLKVFDDHVHQIIEAFNKDPNQVVDEIPKLTVRKKEKKKRRRRRKKKRKKKINNNREYTTQIINFFYFLEITKNKIAGGKSGSKVEEKGSAETEGGSAEEERGSESRRGRSGGKRHSPTGGSGATSPNHSSYATSPNHSSDPKERHQQNLRLIASRDGSENPETLGWAAICLGDCGNGFGRF